MNPEAPSPLIISYFFFFLVFVKAIYYISMYNCTHKEPHSSVNHSQQSYPYSEPLYHALLRLFKPFINIYDL